MFEKSRLGRLRLVLHCTVFFQPTTAVGQFPPPTFVVGMEELASIPDAKAHNRYAYFD
jgi:hypothetical protein